MNNLGNDFFGALGLLSKQLEEDSTVYYIRDTYNTAASVTGFEEPYTSVVNARAALSILLDLSDEERYALFGFNLPANALTIIKGKK